MSLFEVFRRKPRNKARLRKREREKNEEEEKNLSFSFFFFWFAYLFHLVELVDAADASVGEHQGPSLEDGLACFVFFVIKERREKSERFLLLLLLLLLLSLFSLSLQKIKKALSFSLSVSRSEAKLKRRPTTTPFFPLSYLSRGPESPPPSDPRRSSPCQSCTPPSAPGAPRA